MGLEEKDFGDKSYDEVLSTNSMDVSDTLVTVQDQVTTLSTDSSFLQFNGHSSVVIDSKGLFVSIPVTKSNANVAAQNLSKTVTKQQFRLDITFNTR